jgi:serine/threonine protein phosphatase PrpC
MQGWRIDMEDQHTVLLGMPQLPDHSFIAVYDGHGGKQTAQIAGEKLLGYLQRQPSYLRYLQAAAPETLGEAMRTAFLELDRDLPEFLAGASDRSGSTACAVIVTPRHMVCANIGDSRAAMCRVDATRPAYRAKQLVADKRLRDQSEEDASIAASAAAEAALLLSGLVAVALSEDHKPSNPRELERIEAAGGCVEMNRVDGSLATSRALGDFELKGDPSTPAAQCAQKVSPESEIRIVERDAAADQLLIVACDGIWDVMSSERACECALGLMARDGEQDMGLICEEILETCLDLGSRDNMSVVVAAFPAATVAPEGPGVTPLLAERTVRRQAEDDAAREKLEPEPEPEVAGEDEGESDLIRSIKRLEKGAASMGLKPAAAATEASQRPGLDDGQPLPPPSSEEELLKLRGVFETLDTDGSGALDKQEISNALVALGRARFGGALDDAMAMMDADGGGDGEVSFDEFQRWWERGGKLNAAESLELKWQQFGQKFDTMASGLLAGAFGGSV